MRASGILLPISSLPGKYGFGTLGEEAYKFIDFLVQTKQKYWQILPLGPITYGDSPYQAYSAFAGGEYYLDLDNLFQDNLITKEELIKEERTLDNIDYDDLYQSRMPLYKKASKRFFDNLPSDYNEFINREKNWVIAYARFRALKDYFKGVSFNNWPKEFINKEFNNKHVLDVLDKIQDDINLYLFTQYYFIKQWMKLRDYANILGVKLIGDLPIYVSYDSSDVWQNPEEFQLDENLIPTRVAGCPPDAFSEEGQLWGNPLYRYDEMKKNNYSWWIKRIKHNLRLYDMVRIDHFRGFEAYYSIPYGAENAKDGIWIKGPGFDLFNELFSAIGKPEMIMEDLGYLTPSVHQLLHRTGFPGMRVLSFAFDGNKDNAYLPQNYIENTVVYTGTHDNLPLEGLVKTLTEEQTEQIFLLYNIDDKKEIREKLIIAAMSSVAKLAIIPLQDYLGLDETARINTPSTIGINWKWRFSFNLLTENVIKYIKDITIKTYR